MRYTIVIDRASDWRWSQTGLHLETADSFLTGQAEKSLKHSRVINLCRRYSYLSAGYYCSLLSEARGQTPIPTVSDVVAMFRKDLYEFALPELEEKLNRIMLRCDEEPKGDFSFIVCFGQSEDERFRNLARGVFDVFRFPLLRLRVRKSTRWQIHSVRPLGIHHVPDYLSSFFESSLRRFTRSRVAQKSEKPVPLYHLGVLVDPNEKLPPSNRGALDRLVKAASTRRMEVEFIHKKDMVRIPEFDAIFLRETTQIDHHTYQFARKAQLEGVPVIDDPVSILRCTNKVYLHELLRASRIKTPKTISIDRRAFDGEMLERVEKELGYPIVLKIPDGSFSRGVIRAESRSAFREGAEKLLADSRLILAQEYMYTKFDWRVGVLAGKALYVCRYFMSRNHWQIVNHHSDGSFRHGHFDTLRIEDAPPGLVELAVRAAGLIGDGLYGIDLKETEAGFHVIEINDNPNIDHGVEDGILKDELYIRVVDEFIRRIELARAP